MVNARTLALLGGIGLLAFVFSKNRSDPNRITQQDLKFPTVPIAEPVLIPYDRIVEVQTPITLDTALARVKQEYGDIYTKQTERVRADRQIKLGAERWKWTTEFKDVTKEIQL
jgi:hypothetical protein